MPSFLPAVEMTTIKDLLAEGKALPPPEAEKHFTRTIEQAEREKSPLLAELYNRRGISRRMLGWFDESHNDYRQAFIYAGGKEPEAKKQKVSALINIADVQRVGGRNFAKAHITLDEALTFAEWGSLMHAQAVDQRGLLFRAEGDYVNALAYYNEAIQICEHVLKQFKAGHPQDNPEELEAKDRLGQIHQHLGEAAFEQYQEVKSPRLLRQAYQSQEKVIEIFSGMKNQLHPVVSAHKMMGLIDLEKNDTDSALEHLREACRMAKEVTKYPRSVGIISLYVAEVYLIKGNSGEAVSYLNTFRDHILDGSIPAHDYKIIAPTYQRVMRQCESALIKVEGLEGLKEKFE